MIRKIATYHAEDNKGRCDVMLDLKDEMFFIEYYDNNGKMFFTEEFPNKSIHYVQDAAENWSVGIKKLEENAF
jgi:hypothetical protein